MKKALYIILLLALFIISSIGLLLIDFKSDLLQEAIQLSEYDLYNYIVDNCTPIKSEKNDVLRFIHKNGYTIDSEVNLPFLEDSKGYRVASEHPKVVARYGDNYIRVYLGEYIDVIADEEGSFPYTCSVIVYWVFDGNELVYINVSKDWDGT